MMQPQFRACIHAASYLLSTNLCIVYCHKTTIVCQAMELSGVGLKSRMVGDEVELEWRTADETGNKVNA